MFLNYNVFPLVFPLPGVLLLAEQLDGAVVPAEPGSTLHLPPMFREVGPSVNEWVEYLRTISDDLDKQNASTDIWNPARQEEKLFLQVGSCIKNVTS